MGEAPAETGLANARIADEHQFSGRVVDALRRLAEEDRLVQVPDADDGIARAQGAEYREAADGRPRSGRRIRPQRQHSH